MNRGKKILKKILTVLLICLTVCGGLVISPETASAAGASVVISVEKFTIGKGWIVEPEVVSITENETVASVLTRFMKEKGYPLEVEENSTYGWYLAGIQNADNGGTLDIPDFILNYAKKCGDTNFSDSLTNEYAPTLQEFSYWNTSGWLYSVNNSFPSYTMENYNLQDKDVIRLQFSVYGTGLDVEGSYGGTTLYSLADKSALLTRLAYINQNPDNWLTTTAYQTAYDTACEVAQKLNATQTEVNNALSALPNNEVIWPESVVLSQTSLTLYDNDAATRLTATVYPEDTDFTDITWLSSDEEVASVDAYGRVTPHSTGQTEITAMAQNGVSSTCVVTVTNRPFTSITLDRLAVSMQAENTCALQVSGSPSNATETLSVTWSSSDESVATVSQDGVITAVSAGSAVITAATESGLTASCTVTVGDAKELAEYAEALVNALPNAGDLTIDDADQVQEASDAFSSLTEESLSYLSDSASLQAKLSRCVSAMETLLEEYENVDEAEELIAALPSLSALSINDRSAVEAAADAYSSLTASEKTLLSAASLKKLQSAQNRIEELQEEILETGTLLASIPSEVTTADAEVVLEATEAYAAMEELQQAQIADDLKARLQSALDTLTEQITAAVNALDMTATASLKQEATADFVLAAQARDLLYDRLSLSDETEAAIETAKTWLAAGIQSKAGVTVSADWFVANSSAKTTDTEAAIEAVTEKYETADTSTAQAWEVAYTDIRTDEAYTPEKKLSLTFTVRGLSSMENPKVFTYIDGTLKELSATIDSGTGTVTVKSAKTGMFLVVDVPVTLTGLDLTTTAKVTKGSTVTLTPVKVPEDATAKVSYSWKSSDTSVATVDANGIVTGVSEGTATITVSADGITGAKASCKVTVVTTANALSKSVSDVLAETKAYILSSDTNPTIGSEWYVIGLARSGMDLSDSYFTTYYNHFANYLEEQKGVLSTTTYSDYSKAILTMTAIGKDARDIAGYNLLSYLADFDNVKKQGLNGPIWALIALNSSPDYTIPEVSGVSEQTTESKLISYILEKQLDDGGWALSGTDADTDMTGMALQSLAPYYNKEGYEEVTAAINEALNTLGEMQLSTGGYGTMGVETSESNAQVITALCALGINPQTDARFIKNGSWTVENLISYHIDDSGFMHVKAGAGNNGGAAAGSVDGLATGQGYYALVAYQRLLDGKTGLYDMSDMTVSSGEKGDGTGTGLTDDNTSTSGSTASSSGSGSSTTSSTAKTATSTVGRTATKLSSSAASSTDDDDDEDEEEESTELWSFDGDDYEADDDIMEVTETSGTEETDENAEDTYGDGGDSVGMSTMVKEYIPWILCVLCGAAVIGVCIFFKKKS